MKTEGRWAWVEWPAIIAAILSLWPVTLGWPHPVWRILMYLMLGLMAALFAVNIRRLWKMGHPPADHREE